MQESFSYILCLGEGMEAGSSKDFSIECNVLLWHDKYDMLIFSSRVSCNTLHKFGVADIFQNIILSLFAEKNMLSLLIRFLEQKSQIVRVQLLQTINILLENLRNRNSLYYLLSNNHINNVIVYKYDFSDDEHQQNFPLYTEAIKFFDHSESMVRTAVRTLTLNVFRVADPPMLRFIRNRTAIPYFSSLAWSIGNVTLQIDTYRIKSSLSNCSRLKDLVAEHVDHLHYINDIYCLNIGCLNSILTDQLLNRLIIPLYVNSLLTQEMPRDDGDNGQSAKTRIHPAIAIYLLSQIFYIISYRPLISCLCDIVLYGEESILMTKAHKSSDASSNTSSGLMKKRSVSLLGCYRVFGPPQQGLSQTLSAFKVKTTTATVNTSFDGDQFLFPESSSDELSVSSDSESSFSDVGTSTTTEIEQRQDEENSNNQSDASSSAMSKIDNQLDENSLSTLKSTSTLTADSGWPSEINTENGSLIDSAVEKNSNICDDANSESTEATDNLSTVEGQLNNRSSTLFWKELLKYIESSDEDTAILFILILVNGILETKGISPSLLKNLLPLGETPKAEAPHHYELVEKLFSITEMSCSQESHTRLVTFEVLIRTLEHLSINPHSNARLLCENHVQSLYRVLELSAEQLRVFYTVEDVFLDMFEDEYRSLKNNKPIGISKLIMDGSLLLPYSRSSITTIEFSKRLPCNSIERARRAMRIYLMTRKLVNKFEGTRNNNLSLFDIIGSINVKDVLELSNIDLIACHVITSEKMVRRFLAIRETQFILVDTDSTKYGWGIVRFVGNLQDVEVSSERDDNKSLQISIRQTSTATAISRGTLSMLTAKFVFTDHINCIVARQRLKRGRLIVRQKKLYQLGQVLGISFSAANQAANADDAANIIKNDSTSDLQMKPAVTEEFSTIINEAPKPQHELKLDESTIDNSRSNNDSVTDEATVQTQSSNSDTFVNKATDKSEISASNVQLLPPSPVFEITSGNEISEDMSLKGSLNRSLGTANLGNNDSVRLLPPLKGNSAQKNAVDGDSDNNIEELRNDTN
ncbi:uncharacterized protein TRIADDRAFT_53756 [Trichoplax adhaerens]|uniref:FPL domain-containing protein n=1 Tax=Trichoplax adhaerens TaxID=10228 RepID=B3RQ29_TRIAD|nr:hypothetical protein TRIADDRAFT_53756 [Trichoplax adhaerens]EDV28283.1 hypothetical protein TRIADDRAFT_53756 [Trichoplax adhaerens]|eukprot:XP_002110117.1 hypothetical protein TRIADDRAFT_53756 [Trichoplax adhaerens]